MIDKQVRKVCIADDAITLVDFCKFICGLPMPPQQMVSIRFSTDDTQKFPVAETCFVWPILLTTHISFADFSRYMDMALKFEATGFYIK